MFAAPRADRPPVETPSVAPAVIAFVVGGMGIVVGVVSAGIAVDAKAKCEVDRCPGLPNVADWPANNGVVVQNSIVAGIGFAVAGLGAGVGTVLLVTRRSSSFAAIQARARLGWIGIEGTF